MYEFLIALVLILHPDLSNVEVERYYTPELESMVHKLILEMELVDEREMQMWNGWANSGREAEVFAEKVYLVNERYNQMKHAPELEELRRFPDQKAIKNFLECNYKHMTGLIELKKLMPPQRGEEIDVALSELAIMLDIYQNLYQAYANYNCTAVRRIALKEVKKTVGDYSFYSGMLPPSVPTWRVR